MTKFHLHVHENDGQKVPDICGEAVDLINVETSGSKAVSLAVVYIEPGKSSTPHYHRVTEEIYYFLNGYGRVIVGEEIFNVTPGSSVYIPLGLPHQVINDSSERMKLISADSPPYQTEDVIPADLP